MMERTERIPKEKSKLTDDQLRQKLIRTLMNNGLKDVAVWVQHEPRRRALLDEIAVSSDVQLGGCPLKAQATQAKLGDLARRGARKESAPSGGGR